MDYVVTRSGAPDTARTGVAGESVVRLRGLPFNCEAADVTKFFAGTSHEPDIFWFYI